MKSKNNTFVRSVQLNNKYVNQSKKDVLALFLEHYRIAMVNYIDYFWNHHNLDGNYTSSDLNKQKYYPYSSKVNNDSILSGRALKCAASQAMGMINSAISKQSDRYHRLRSIQESDNPDKRQISNLQRKIHKTKLVKPTVPKNVSATLDSNNSIIHDTTNTSFDMCIELKSLFHKDYKYLTPNNDNKLPLLMKTHRRYWHWFNNPNSKRTNSILINKKGISIRFKVTKSKKKRGIKVAIDQGIKTCITAIDINGEYQQSDVNNHDYDLEQICKIMVNKTKGTNSYKKAQDHRRNYVNWCINQLNLDPYNELVLEHVYNIGYKSISSEFLKKFPTQIIKDKLQSTCEEKGVLFSLQTSAYRSQRCSDCGFVHSRNRKAKMFICTSCGFSEDSDINAAANHLVVLPDIDRYLIAGINKSTGFYWNPMFDGVYTPISVV